MDGSESSGKQKNKTRKFLSNIKHKTYSPPPHHLPNPICSIQFMGIPLHPCPRTPTEPSASFAITPMNPMDSTNFFRTVDDYIGCHKENDNLKCACRAFKPHLGASRRFERVLMETADRILASCEARIKRHKEKEKRKEPSEDLEALIGELREFKKIYVDAKGRDEHCLLKKLNYMATALRLKGRQR